MERLASERRPDEFSDVGRSWVLRYPTSAGRPRLSDLLPFGWLVRGVHWLGFTLAVLLRRKSGRDKATEREGD